MHIWCQKIVESCSFWRIFSIFSFSKFFMISKGSDSQNHLRGLISCPGQLPNRSRLEFHIYSEFSVHILFMCRPCAKLFSSALHPQNLQPRWIDSIFNIVLISQSDYAFEFSNFEHNSDYHPNLMNLGRKPTCVDESRLGKKSRHLTPYYSLSSISKRYKLYESLI